MSYQRRSEVPKKGEGEVHYDSKFFISDILTKMGWQVQKEKLLSVNWRFNDETEETEVYGHLYDIYARLKHKNGLISEVIIEVDGEEHYENPTQMSNDIKAHGFINFFRPDIYFVRIDKNFVDKNKNKKSIVIKELNKKIKEKYSLDEFFLFRFRSTEL